MARHPDRGDRDAGGLEAAGVGLTLVADRIELGGHDQCGREAGEVTGEIRRRVGVARLRGIGEIDPGVADTRVRA